MHEANFTKQIVNVIMDQLTQYPESRPRTVKVAVGEMLHLVPDSVQMHFDLLTKDTSLEKVELELGEIPVVVNCHQCGREGGVEDHHLLLCSHCQSLDVELKSGNEIRIESIELEAKR